jgi:hypothetical protein
VDTPVEVIELSVAEYWLLSCKRCPGEKGLAMKENAGSVGDKPHFHLKIHTGRYTHSLALMSLLAERAILGIHLTPKCDWQMKSFNFDSKSESRKRAVRGGVVPMRLASHLP